MKIAFGELPSDLSPDKQSVQWCSFEERLLNAAADAVLLNEMAFCPWFPATPKFDAAEAVKAIATHSQAIDLLADLPINLIFGTRPVFGEEKLRNEGFALRNGSYTAVHTKQHFPQEKGFYEQSWFEPDDRGFAFFEVGSVKVGFLICTELMFTEYARSYAKMGAHALLVPRASSGDLHVWHTAAAMPAITSGCYVISSNRAGQNADVNFNGRGFVIAPDGTLIAETSRDDPLKTVDIDTDLVSARRKEYPCYLFV